jgi:23S rRNA (adenine2503-C2)-methyltransferase
MMILKDMTLPELRAHIKNLGEKRFRADQIFEWMYKPGITSPDQMSNIPTSLREALPPALMTLTAEKEQISQKDGTRKFLFRTIQIDDPAASGGDPVDAGGDSDAHGIETVFMKYRYGNSVCISSQAGCRMGCSFCASGLPGLVRNLSAGEMVDQILLAQNLTGAEIRHVVVMGTGEPMDNLENLVKFINIISDPKGLGLSKRNITVSTCGLLPELERFWKMYPQVGVAISLHAPNDEIRNRLMPVGHTYGVDALLAAAARYVKDTGRRITFEYALIEGVNDGESLANELCHKLKGLNCHVNLIPLNNVQETGLRKAGREKIERFAQILDEKGIQSTIRRELGADIAAACGQLRLEALAND